MSVRRWVVVVCLAIGICLASCGGIGLRSGGPLRVDSFGASTVSGMQVAAPRDVAFGFNLMTNTGTEPITDIAAALHPTPLQGLHVRFKRLLVVDLHAHGLTSLGVGPWPFEDIPVRDTQNLRGYVLKPSRYPIELVFVISVSGSGRAKWDATTISYRYGGATYLRTVHNGLILCAPAKLSCD